MTSLRLLLLLPPALLLAACASHMSEVEPVGKDRYRVSYNAGMHAASWVEVKNTARERARAYCSGQGLRMTQPETYSNSATGLGAKEATLVFTCEKPPA
ncbi:MAG TPA: hypothetical protein VGC69_04780 [Bordetella sp.]